jgi:serine/arginine repetitive matrix protein 2
MKTPKTSKTSKKQTSVKRRKSKSKVKIPVTTRGGLFGYHVYLPEKKRRSLLKFLLSRKKASYSEIIKRLNVLSIYNKRKHPETTRKVKRDIDFLHKHYQKYSLTFQHHRSKSRSKQRSRSTKRRSRSKQRSRSTKRRSRSKQRSTKRRSTKRRSTKRRSTKRRSTKRRSTKRRSTKRRSTKRRSRSKRRSIKGE